MISRERIILNAHQIPAVGMMWPIEMGWLYDFFKSSITHLEIGTYCGRSTYVTGLTMNGGNGGSITCVDNLCEADLYFSNEWATKVRNATFDEVRKAGTKIDFHAKNSVDAARDLSGHIKYDSIFIDGGHDYYECKSDIECWLPFLKDGGIISGHDYWPNHQGVMQAVQECFSNKFSVYPNTRIWYVRQDI